MKSLISLLTVVSLGAFSLSAQANMDLAKAKNCTACHAVDKKLIGPGFKEITAKYSSDKEATSKLVKRVREGSAVPGVWGQIPMPANPQVSEAEAQTLVKWILDGSK